MKKLLPSILLAVLSVLFTLQINAQSTVNSTTGYTVSMDVRPVRIIITQSWSGGYNYQVEMSYTLRFTGSNMPSNLWNMNGTLGCTNKTNGFQIPTTPGTGTVLTWNTSGSGDYRTATVASLGCGAVTMDIEGPGIARQNVAVAQPIVLGIKLSSFIASVTSGKVSLDWSTESEANNEFFTIERSANGSSWSPISKVQGATNSSSVNFYQYTDAAPLNGTSYYRIRQTDLDGQSTVSATRTVSISAIARSISLYPVPNTGNSITVTGIRDYNNYQLTVIGANGNAAYSTTLKSSSVELPRLTTGFYFIRITDKTSGEVTNIRYIKN